MNILSWNSNILDGKRSTWTVCANRPQLKKASHLFKNFILTFSKDTILQAWESGKLLALGLAFRPKGIDINCCKMNRRSIKEQRLLKTRFLALHWINLLEIKALGPSLVYVPIYYVLCNPVQYNKRRLCQRDSNLEHPLQNWFKLTLKLWNLYLTSSKRLQKILFLWETKKLHSASDLVPDKLYKVIDIIF